MNIVGSFRSVDFSDGEYEMAGVYASGADHRAFPAQLAGRQKTESLVRMGVMQFLDGGAKACRHEMSRRADSGATSAGHALAHIRLHRGQLFELLSVKEVKIDSGTWNQTETETTFYRK